MDRMVLENDSRIHAGEPEPGHSLKPACWHVAIPLFTWEVA